MPTQRQHGGAELVRIPTTLPGFKGLNLQYERSILTPDWATSLQNCAFDRTNRIACRKGWNNLTTTAMTGTPQVVELHEQVKRDSSVLLVASSATQLWSSTDGASWTDITGTASFTSGDWHFINWFDKVVGLQEGKTPIVYSGTTFSHITAGSGTAPTGGVGLAMGGRLWILDSDYTTIKYSALLDETDWGSTDAGSFDMTNVWNENDKVTAMAFFNGAWIVFGTNNIAIYTDGKGSAKGISPTQAYLADTITGVGCISQKTIQYVEGDLWFLSQHGLQSFSRLIQQKSNPLENLSANVRDTFINEIANATTANIRTVYSPEEQFYLVSLPSLSATGDGTTDAGKVWYFDTRMRMETGATRVATWNGLVPRAMVHRKSGQLVMARYSQAGKVGEYSTYQDNGVDFTFVFETGWLDMGIGEFIKIPKRLRATIYASQSQTLLFKWAYNFANSFKTQSVNLVAQSTAAEWGIGEWGLGEFGGGLNLMEKSAQSTGSGRVIKLGLQLSSNNNQFSVQDLDLYAKIGRMV